MPVTKKIRNSFVQSAIAAFIGIHILNSFLRGNQAAFIGIHFFFYKRHHILNSAWILLNFLRFWGSNSLKLFLIFSMCKIYKSMKEHYLIIFYIYLVKNLFITIELWISCLIWHAEPKNKRLFSEKLLIFLKNLYNCHLFY